MQSTATVTRHGYVRQIPILSDLGWARFADDVRRLHRYMLDRPCREPLLVRLMASTHEVRVERPDAVDGADSLFAVRRAVPKETWRTMTAATGGCQAARIDLDDQPSSVFIQGVLVLMRMHFRSHIAILSAAGSPAWDAAAWGVMAATFSGPWTDQDVAR